MSRKIKTKDLPKRLAGVKIPKPYRKGLRKLARKQDGRTLVGEALLALAASVAASQLKPGSATRNALSRNIPKAKARAEAMLPAAGDTPSALGAAIGAAARAFAVEFDRRSAAASPPSTGAASH